MTKEELNRLKHFEAQIARRKGSGTPAPTCHKSGIVRRQTREYPSVLRGCNTERAERQQYTGTRIVGIGVMHKSNLVPITRGDELKGMRR